MTPSKAERLAKAWYMINANGEFVAYSSGRLDECLRIHNEGIRRLMKELDNLRAIEAEPE